MTQIVWNTPAGNLGTYAEQVEFSLQLNAINPTAEQLDYRVVSGQLPPGIQLYRNGLLYGIPNITAPGPSSSRKFSFTIRARNLANQISDRSFLITINGIAPPSLITTESLGSYFDGDYISLQLLYTETNNSSIKWSVSNGELPQGLSLTQTGKITGFAQTPPAGGPAGTAAYDQGSYDQFVWDFEGATLSRTYKFIVRIFDGILSAERNYSLTVFAKSFFRTDNTLILSDTTAFTADRDGYQYPTITTLQEELIPVRQDRAYAFQFKAYYANSLTPVYWKIVGAGPELYDMGAPPFPDDQGKSYDLTTFDEKAFDQPNLSVPSGLSLDKKTGWLTGTIGATTKNKSIYTFKVVAFVEVPVSATAVSIRESTPLTYTLTILEDINNYLTWNTPADLGMINNGQVSTLDISASSSRGRTLYYTIQSGEYSRLPQGLQLLPSGLISGKTSFDFYSMDRNAVSIITDGGKTTFDASYTFTVLAQDAIGIVSAVAPAFNSVTLKSPLVDPVGVGEKISFIDIMRVPVVLTVAKDSAIGDTKIIFTSSTEAVGINWIATPENSYTYDTKQFTVTVKNVDQHPYESLYVRAFLPSSLRQRFYSSLYDPTLTRNIGTDPIYRPDDPYFGRATDIRFLAVAGLTASTPQSYIDAMTRYHENKKVNFSDLKIAIATDENLNTKYEVIYIEVVDSNPKALIDSSTNISDPTDTTSMSNTFGNMTAEIVNAIGYEYQGALPGWMTSVQPSTGQPIGFVRALVLAYLKPGAADVVLFRYTNNLLSSGFGISTLLNQWSFLADRYQLNNASTLNYDTTSNTFIKAVTTTFDRIPSFGQIDNGPWNARVTGITRSLKGIDYGAGEYIAVGDNATIINSLGGDTWRTIPQFVDLGYHVGILFPADAGATLLSFAYGAKFSLGDEILSTGAYQAASTSHITTIVESIQLSRPTIGIVPSGSVIEFIDFEGNNVANLTTISSAVAGATYLEFSDISSIDRGYSMRIKGLQSFCIGEITNSTTVTLSANTTVAIPSTTTILFDDLSGNVANIFYLQTSTLAAANVGVLRFSSTASLRSGTTYYVSTANIATQTERQNYGNGVVGVIAGSTGAWTATIGGLASTTGMFVGQQITAIGAKVGSVMTDSAVTTITSVASSIINITNTGVFTPIAGTIGNIIVQQPTTTVKTLLTNISVTQSAVSSIAAGAELFFNSVITSDANAGDSIINLSSTDRIGIGSSVIGSAIVSTTDETATWPAVSPAGTSLNITIPTVDIVQTYPFVGMTVQHYEMPLDNQVTGVATSGSDTIISLSFASTTVTGNPKRTATVSTGSVLGYDGIVVGLASLTNVQLNDYVVSGNISIADRASITFIWSGNSKVIISSTKTISANETITLQQKQSINLVAPQLVPDGTVVSGKTATHVVLSSPLLAPLKTGYDSAIKFGLGDIQLNYVLYTGLDWIAVGSKGIAIRRSADGVWAQNFAVVYGDLLSVAYAPGVSETSVAVGTEGLIVISNDFVNWIRVEVGVAVTLRSIDYHDGYFVAVGDAGVILYSSNGTTWQINNSVTTKNLNSVKFLNNNWIIVGQKGTVLVSSSPSVWNSGTLHYAGVTYTLNDVSYVNNNYLAVGNKGIIVTSADGTAWTSRDSNETVDLLSIANNGQTPVISGNNGLVLTESNNFTVKWAVRGISFEMFNYNSLVDLAAQGYPVQNGDTLIFAQQEGFDPTKYRGGSFDNDGWNLYDEVYGGDTVETYDAIPYDFKESVTGYYDSLLDSSVTNKRAGIWQVQLNQNGIVVLVFVRQVRPNQVVMVITETSRLVYDPQIGQGSSAPTYKLLHSAVNNSSSATVFDTNSTRFNSPKDQYLPDPNTYDKYLKYPSTGVL